MLSCLFNSMWSLHTKFKISKPILFHRIHSSKRGISLLTSVTTIEMECISKISFQQHCCKQRKILLFFLLSFSLLPSWSWQIHKQICQFGIQIEFYTHAVRPLPKSFYFQFFVNDVSLYTFIPFNSVKLIFNVRI